MKKILVLLILSIACPTVAGAWNEQEARAKSAEAAMRRVCPLQYIETWKDKENRTRCEENFKLQYYDQTPRPDNSANMQGQIDSQNAEIQRQNHEMQIQQSQQQIQRDQQRLNDIYRH
jgi:TolA-binding protein